MSADREYHFLMRTVDVGGLERPEVERRLSRTLGPVWAELVAEGVLREGRALWRVGDVDLATDADTAGATWQLTLLAEISEAADPLDVAEREQQGLLAGGAFAAPLVVRSRELLVRRARSGTAVPRPRDVGGLPDGFTAAVEHMWVPPERWLDYREAMRTVFGPVGILLLRWGAAHRVTITEVAASLERDGDVPEWNQVHVLEGRFVDGDDGFEAACTRAIRELLGPDTDIRAELARVAAYRRKPAMTNNVELRIGTSS